VVTKISELFLINYEDNRIFENYLIVFILQTEVSLQTYLVALKW
jgi:hypothetical protein